MTNRDTDPRDRGDRGIPFIPVQGTRHPDNVGKSFAFFVLFVFFVVRP